MVDLIVLRIYGFNVSSLKLMFNISFLTFILGLFLLLGSRIFYKVASNASHTIWRESVAMIPLIFFTVFVINFNQELSRVQNSEDISQVLKLLGIGYVYFPLMLAIIFTITLSAIFIVLDHLIVKERSSPKSSLS